MRVPFFYTLGHSYLLSSFFLCSRSATLIVHASAYFMHRRAFLAKSAAIVATTKENHHEWLFFIAGNSADAEARDRVGMHIFHIVTFRSNSKIFDCLSDTFTSVLVGSLRLARKISSNSMRGHVLKVWSQAGKAVKQVQELKHLAAEINVRILTMLQLPIGFQLTRSLVLSCQNHCVCFALVVPY